MSDREFWVSNSIRLQNRIVRWLDIRFPEYPSVFKDWTCKRSLATLKAFPCPLQTYTVPDVIKSWRAHMQRAGGSTGIEKAALLIAHAKCSVGDGTAVAEAKADLNRLIEEWTSRLYYLRFRWRNNCEPLRVWERYSPQPY